VVTCADGASFLAEIARRLINDKFPSTMTVRERLEALRPIIAPHLETLQARSRPVDDWILDCLTQPWIGRLFPIADAISALGDDFDVYGLSPRFFTDWRWYKELTGKNRSPNEGVLGAYYRNIANLVDYRVILDEHSPEFGKALLELCDRVYLQMQALENGDGALGDILATLTAVEQMLWDTSPKTARSIVDVITYLNGEDETLNEFASFFGRGQQFLSFIRQGSGLLGSEPGR
jgi:hypothetical protein